MSQLTVRPFGAARPQASAADTADLRDGWRPQVWLGAPTRGGLGLPSGAPSMSWMSAPRAVFVDADHVVVADSGNHRVLIWHGVPTEDEQPADVVLLGPAPFEGEPDEPAEGVVAGFGQMRQVDPNKPWSGSRWVLETESGQHLSLTLSIMLFDSSGVNKDAPRKEHHEALLSCVAAASDTDCDPIALACALDWLLYDWLMAHRENADSAAIEIPKGHESDAGVTVAAAAASVRARAQFDPGLGTRLLGRS